jgi:hypothetical protein
LISADTATFLSPLPGAAAAADPAARRRCSSFFPGYHLLPSSSYRARAVNYREAMREGKRKTAAGLPPLHYGNVCIRGIFADARR